MADKERAAGRMPYMAKCCPISRREFARLLHQEKMNLRDMGVHLHTTDVTARKWMRLFGLDAKRFDDWNTIQDAVMIVDKENGAIIIDWIPQEANDDNETKHEIAVTEHRVDEELNDSERAWLSLSPKAREVITVMASFSPEYNNLKDYEIAAKVGISTHTMTQYRTNPVFERCLLEAMRQSFHGTKGPEKFYRDMMNRYHGNASLAKEDRQLMARVLGLERNGMAMAVQVNVQLPRGIKEY